MDNNKSIASKDNYIYGVQIDHNYNWKIHISDTFSYPSGERNKNASFRIEIEDPLTGKYYKTRRSVHVGWDADQRYVDIFVDCDNILQGHHYQVKIFDIQSTDFQKNPDKNFLRFEKKENRIVACLISKQDGSKITLSEKP